MIAFVLLLAAAQGGGQTACDLLRAEDVRAVQQAPLARTTASADARGGLVFAHCFFATDDYVRSVSLSLVRGRTPKAGRDYWEQVFRSPSGSAKSRPASSTKKAPPRPIAGVGDEAFWTGDARSGALYVLSGGTVLRISVGGVADEAERIRRSRALAEAALRKIQ